VLFRSEEFSKHVGTEFYASTGKGEVKLTLIEVKPYMPDTARDQKMERFSLFFDGASDAFLPQQSLRVQHPSMGKFELFLVPVSGDQNEIRYEAVFNYFK